MTSFTADEINLMCIYDPGNRAGTISELLRMSSFLMPDETSLMLLTQSVIRKLEAMTDEEYNTLSEALTPDCFVAFDDADDDSDLMEDDDSDFFDAEDEEE